MIGKGKKERTPIGLGTAGVAVPLLLCPGLKLGVFLDDDGDLGAAGP